MAPVLPGRGSGASSFAAAGIRAPAILPAHCGLRPGVRAAARVALLIAAGTARATAADTPDYTAAQAAAGAQVYAVHCAACHGADLTGGAAPELTGVPFRAQWATPRRSLLDLLTYLHANMPLGAAGSLPPSDYLSVLAFMLQQNGQPATGQALRDDGPALAAMAFARRPTTVPVSAAVPTPWCRAQAARPRPNCWTRRGVGTG